MGQLEQRNKDVVRSYLAALSKGDLETAESLYDDALIWTMPFDPEYSPIGGTRNKAQVMEQSRRMRAPLPNGMNVEIKSIVAEGDRVAVEAVSAADTPVGPYSNRYHFAFQLRDGKIVSGSEYLDSAYLNAFIAKLAAAKVI